MAPNLILDVLDAWERSAGLSVHDRATLALRILGGDACDNGALPLYERDNAVLTTYSRLFGDRFEGVVRCPACAVEFELKLDLCTLRSATVLSEPFWLEREDCAAWVRPPLATEIAGLSGSLPAATLADSVFALCIANPTRNGEAIVAADLPASFREAASDELARRGLEGTTVDLTCGECSNRWRSPVDIVRALLGELDLWVRRLLDDVHRIATAYHWSEQDILGLPLRRRLYYLGAIG